jgi:hypothetical protein
MKRTRLFLVLATCLLCVGAQAQWQWIDKDGQKVFSDRAPPPDIPARRILKQPGAPARFAIAAEAPSQAASSATSAAESGQDVPKIAGIDKELAERKKQSEVAAAAKARADLDQQQKVKADNCERARASKALMDSGVRVSLTTNAKGEREVLDDAGRAAEMKRIQTVMETNCK